MKNDQLSSNLGCLDLVDATSTRRWWANDVDGLSAQAVIQTIKLVGLRDQGVGAFQRAGQA